jgi:hypothetical protein
MNEHTLTALIHGTSGVGKSWLSDTAPKPLLILDAEGGARWGIYSGRKVYWDPKVSGPPEADGTWDTCIVTVTDYGTVDSVWQWLRSGQHPFFSVKMDSLMEIQRRCIDGLRPGTAALDRDDYGALLREIEKKVRDYRDLTLIPATGVRVVLFITGTDEEPPRLPLLTGSIRKQLSYYIDVVGYLYKTVQADGSLVRSLLVDETPGFTAKDRTNRLKAHYGSVILLPEDGTQYIEQFYGLLANGNHTAPQAQEGVAA